MNDRKNTTIPSEAEALLLGRSALYRLLARTLSEPVQLPPSIDADYDVAIHAADLLRLPEVKRTIGAMKKTRPQSTDEARAIYTRVFGLVAHSEAPPFEMEYEAKSDLFFRSQRLADVAGFYKAFQLDLAQRERPDHVAVEAEFLWYLLERIAAAQMRNHTVEKRQILEDAFLKFFTEHFGKWTPSFSATLRESASSRGVPFFENVASFLLEWAKEERRTLGISDSPPLCLPTVSVENSAPDCVECCGDVSFPMK